MLKYMKFISFLFVLSAGTCFANEIAQQQKLDELVVSIQEANKEKNIPKIMSFMDKDLIIKKEYDSVFPGFTYESYEHYLVHAFPKISNYQYKILEKQYSRDKSSGLLIAKIKIREMYFVGSKYFNETHDQVWAIKEINDQYKVAKVTILN